MFPLSERHARPTFANRNTAIYRRDRAGLEMGPRCIDGNQQLFTDGTG